MKRFLFLLTIVFLHIEGNAQPSWAWAIGAGGSNTDASYAIATDANDFVYITGTYNNPDFTIGGVTLPYTGIVSDVFIGKFDADGNLIWLKHASGNLDETARGIAVDALGNVFVTGYFYSQVLSFGNVSLTQTGARDAFLVKYDSAGNALWARSSAGSLSDDAVSVAVDAGGNSYICGYSYSDTIYFDNVMLVNDSLDYFVAKYDPSGNLQWAVNGGGSHADALYSISVEQGNVFVGGSFESDTVFVAGDTLLNAGKHDALIVKLDANGNEIWAKGFGGDENEIISDVLAGASSLSVSGTFGSDSLFLDSLILYNINSDDIFISKMDTAGSFMWAKGAGSLQSDHVRGLCQTANGNIYIAGYFSGVSIAFETDTLISAGFLDVFISAYDENGAELWVTHAGGNSGDNAMGIAADLAGNLYITGYHQSSQLAFGSTVLTNAGYFDIYLAKLGSLTALNEYFSDQSFFVFPNPSSGNINIISSQSIDEVSVFSSSGSLIYSGNVSAFSVDADPGVYFIHLKTADHVLVKKLILVD